MDRALGHRTSPLRAALLGAVALVLATGCATTRPEIPPDYQLFQAHERHLGVDVTIAVYAENQEHADRGFRAAFRRIAAVDRAASDTSTISELRVLSGISGSWYPVSRELYDMVEASVELAHASGGAFDPTVGPCVLLWEQARRSGRLPDANRIASARAAAGFEKIEFDKRRRQLRLNGRMRLVLGGVERGYAADRAIDALTRHEIDAALVRVGDDVVASYAPPGEPGWPVEVLLPDGEMETILLENRGVSGAGIDEKVIRIGEQEFSEVIDPRTGLGCTTRVHATVVAESGMLADGLATALRVMGPEDGLGLALEYEATAWAERLD